MFVKKAGTILLAVSIVLWAIMSFPPLPEEKAKPFEDKEARLTAAFLANPAVGTIFKSDGDVQKFEEFLKEYQTEGKNVTDKKDPVFVALASALKELESKNAPLEASKAGDVVLVAQAYADFASQKQAIEGEKQSERLKNTMGGRIGVALETIFRPMEFDWRTNVALLGGFAAKEVIVSTLGTAYSLGDVDPKKAESLSEKLRKEPGWSPLKAFALLLFVMLYNPCIATLVTIRKETGSWRWVLFAMAYTTILAYCVAVLVYSSGSLMKLGV
jgi:ferrous iron transport protein B